ncbi:hypothetical protein [Guptibacillus hwajinpoensis]|uniref:Uncharacterized protein n=1 Tax=Guptibacillus hwajinpoensis TaxID=208199 RepID=A0A0J6CZC4_9BACL|nr:hypothetical protein [Alkalihalobacillus macyae]KMM38458.1 hypothetical protein AB986_03945 [Alkalihalobacillus macyae]
MRKNFLILVLSIIIAVCGLYAYLIFNPPLEVGTLASTKNEKSVVVGVGNTGLTGVEIVSVTVNNNEDPLQTKVQVSNPLQGFIITDDYYSEESTKYRFTEIEQVNIKTGTAPLSNFQNLDEGAASENDEAYGISVTFSEPINEVQITYKYLGISFEKIAVFH